MKNIIPFPNRKVSIKERVGEEGSPLTAFFFSTVFFTFLSQITLN